MDVFVKDIDRPLSRTGYEDAYRISKQIIPIVSENILFVSSPSVRTYSTAAIFSDTLNKKHSSIKIVDRLYETGIDEYMDTISSVNDDISSLLLFGHNPTIGELIFQLSGTNHGDIAPGTVGYFEADIARWQDITGMTSKLKGLFSPKS